MKNILLFSFIFFISHSVQSQEKIKADFQTIDFLGKTPYKTPNNSMTENLLRILYFNPKSGTQKKIGFMNSRGKTIINPKYTLASDFYNGYANIIKDSIYGYINKKGEETLFPQYDQTYFYYSNTGIAKKNGKYGLIDRSGNPLSDFSYIMINLFGFDHFSGVLSKDKTQLLNEDAKIVFNQDFKFDIKSYYFENDSLLVFEKSIDSKKLQGLVKLNGEIILEPIYDKITFIEDKFFFVVVKNKKYGFINKEGKVIIPLIYEEVSFNITENLICAKLNNKWGFINRAEEIVIPFEYDEAYPFFDGVAIVRKEKTYVGIDKKNKIKTKLGTLKSKFPFSSNNLILFEEEGKYGYVDKNGKIVVPAKFEYAYPFVDGGIAYVELKGKSGFINKKGKEVVLIKYSQLWLESEGLIRFVD